MADAPSDLADRVRMLIAKECGLKVEKVQPSSRIEEDFGITGDDADELLQHFAVQFNVDMSTLKFHNHFGPEGAGCNLFWSTPDWLKEHGNYPVTVDHLIRVAQVGRWYSPPRITK